MSVFSPVKVDMAAVRAALRQNEERDDDDDEEGIVLTGRFIAEWPDPDTIQGISPHQKAELGKATRGRVGFLTGGPGVGKTRCVAALTRSILRDHPAAIVRCVAPTGKAAQRMTESMNAVGIQIRASTIHTALQPQRNGHDGQGWGFFHDESNPMRCHVLICDEASMVDVSLMRHLLAAIEPGTLVLFVGDPDQLPPVGKGRPVADAIEAGMPHGHLTEIHRFAGRIARVCQQIVRGERWTPSERLDPDAEEFPENMRHIEASDTNTVPSLKDILNRIAGRGFNLMTDVQVVCATNDNRERLNAVLQEHLNPNGERIDACPFRVGDKAICLRNQWAEQDWDGPFKPKGNQQHYIANGEIGTVTRIDKGFVVVKVGELSLRFQKSGWKDVALAYAITVWKSQGSQWPVVVTVAEDNRGADMICDRAFWYTGISRAGKISVTLGRRSAIDRQCARAGLYHRLTFLARKLAARLPSTSEHEETVETVGETVELSQTVDPPEWEDFTDV